jgi:hypothetical protein
MPKVSAAAACTPGEDNGNRMLGFFLTEGFIDFMVGSSFFVGRERLRDCSRFESQLEQRERRAPTKVGLEKSDIDS